MTQHRNRPGLTLVEIIVVISIIAVLVGIFVISLSAIWNTAAVTVTQVDMLELKTALELFKTKYTVYPPSKITIPPQLNSADDKILKRIWLKIDYAKAFGVEGLNTSGTFGGDQCLVLFLGGWQDVTNPNSKGCAGFSPNPRNPFERATCDLNLACMKKFKQERLCQLHGAPYLASYGDGWFGQLVNGQTQSPCYAYFSTSLTGTYSTADCPGMGQGGDPVPFLDLKRDPNNPDNFIPTGKFINPTGYQIISAGKDTQFGTATTWAKGSPATWTGTDLLSLDNMASFTSGILQAN